jgi:hypothetical protein
MTPSGIRQMLWRRSDAAGLERRVHPHQLRHSKADAWLSAGGSELGLRKQMGWRPGVWAWGPAVRILARVMCRHHGGVMGVVRRAPGGIPELHEPRPSGPTACRSPKHCLDESRGAHRPGSGLVSALRRGSSCLSHRAAGIRSHLDQMERAAVPPNRATSRMCASFRSAAPQASLRTSDARRWLPLGRRPLSARSARVNT